MRIINEGEEDEQINMERISINHRKQAPKKDRGKNNNDLISQQLLMIVR